MWWNIFTIIIQNMNHLASELKSKLSCFRDFIAYRIVLCMPKCHLKPGEDQETASIRYLYEIANVLPGFLEERGFTVESAYGVKKSTSPLLNEDVKMYYRDYCGTSGERISVITYHSL